MLQEFVMLTKKSNVNNLLFIHSSVPAELVLDFEIKECFSSSNNNFA